MRKFKTWSLLFIMALCVMIFSGCGGSYTEDESSSTDSTTDSDSIASTITSTLNGTWQFDETKGFSGKATYDKDGTSRSITLGHVTDFTISFSGIELTGDSSDLEGTAKVFYSYEGSAYDFDSGVRSYDLGSVSIKSYTNETATDKTTLMGLSQVSEQQWILQSTTNLTDRMTITLSSTSKREFSIQWNVPVYIPELNDYCDCVIIGSLIKYSSVPYGTSTTSDDVSENNSSDSTTTTDKTIDEILKGTWLLHTAESAIATNTTTGAGMTLNPNAGIKMVFTELSDFSNSEVTGTADVYFLHQWLALNGSVLYGNFDVRSYTADNSDVKTQTMTIAKVSDTKWRFEARNTTDSLSVNITIVSDTEISTVWDGWAQVNSLGGYYHYEIECSYRKSSNSTDYDEATPLTKRLITDILTGTWKLVKEGDELSAVNTELGMEDQLTLVMSTSTDITFNDIEDKGDLANKIYSADIDYSYKWEAFDILEIHQGTFSADKTHQPMNLSQRSDDEWRLEAITAGDEALNITITLVSETEIETRWEGIAPLTPEKKCHFIFEGTFKKQ